MHALLLTVVALGGASAHISDQASQTTARPAAYSTATGGGCSSCESCNSDCGCNSDGCRGGLFGKGGGGAPRACGRGMPQTCYSPRFGCYYSNNRHMERYPAFHGYFYRRPYTYRHYFEYPWHAEMHEPTSMFSYNVVSPTAADGGDVPPVPPAAALQPAERGSVRLRSASAIGTGISR